jgi:hypothetical protein
VNLGWIAVVYAILGTGSEAGPWFCYPVGRIGMMLALEPGADQMVTVALPTLGAGRRG